MKVKMLKISSNTENILEVENYLKELMGEMSICSSRFPDILISLTEAVNNAIIHGNKQNAAKWVIINCKARKSGIEFCISDEGHGFDPNAIPDPTSPERLECCGGRGVLIMNTLADQLKYKDNGRTVEMFFKTNAHH
jgi:serine/threonine-protein kinase RsbW